MPKGQKSIPLEVSTEEAQKILQEEKEKRVNECATEINQVLKKHNCDIAVGMLVTKNGNIPQTQVVAL